MPSSIFSINASKTEKYKKSGRIDSAAFLFWEYYLKGNEKRRFKFFEVTICGKIRKFCMTFLANRADRAELENIHPKVPLFAPTFQMTAGQVKNAAKKRGKF